MFLITTLRLTLLVLVPMAPPAAAPSAPPDEVPAVHFVTKQFPPYVYAARNGQAAGPMVDLLGAACERLHWRCQIELLPWRRALTLAQGEQVDGIFPIADTAERQASFRLSPDVVKARYVLLARACEGGTPCGDAGLRPGRTLAAYGPSDISATAQRLLQDAPGTRTETEPDQLSVLRKLGAGRYGSDGLALVNEVVAQQQMAAFGIRDLRTVQGVKELDYAYAFVPTRVDAVRAQAFAEAIRDLCRSGTTQTLFKPYALKPSACQKLQPGQFAQLGRAGS